MRPGQLVKLKVPCLGNEKGTIGVVYYNYGDGFQVIFKNGEYDGFSTTVRHSEGDLLDGRSEADYFLEDLGVTAPWLEGYEFKSVMRVYDDYCSGIFDKVWEGVKS